MAYVPQIIFPPYSNSLDYYRGTDVTQPRSEPKLPSATIEPLSDGLSPSQWHVPFRYIPMYIRFDVNGPAGFTVVLDATKLKRKKKTRSASSITAHRTTISLNDLCRLGCQCNKLRKSWDFSTWRRHWHYVGTLSGVPTIRRSQPQPARRSVTVFTV